MTTLHNHPVTVGTEILSLIAVGVAWLAGGLSPIAFIATALAVVYYCFQIYKEPDLKEWIASFRGLSPAQKKALCALLMTGFRDGIKLTGAYLVGNGMISASDLQFYSGLATIVTGVIWSQIISWQKHKALQGATQ